MWRDSARTVAISAPRYAIDTLIDSHCHLQRKTYGDELEAVIDRAAAAGVGQMVTIGSAGSLAVCHEAIALAEADRRVFATVGFHPHEARAVTDEAVAEVEALARHGRVVAVGEIGLDYHYDYSPRSAQNDAFRRFVDVARRVGKPIVIHNRESDADCIEVFRQERLHEVGGVVHCFTSSWELARTALDAGFYIGFTGIVSFKSAEEVRDVLRRVPRDRIVIETDCPYLAPLPHRGRRNEPAWVTHVAEAVAMTLDAPIPEVRASTTANARRLYGLPES